MLVDLISQGATGWMQAALCAHSRFPDAWFPEKGQSNAPAVGVCSRCPVRAQYLDHAIDNRIEEGIWGGESPQGQRRIARGLVGRSRP